MWILTIIGIAINIIRMILDWFKNDLRPGESPGTRQTEQLSRLLNLTGQLRVACALHAIFAAPDTLMTTTAEIEPALTLEKISSDIQSLLSPEMKRNAIC